jgi:hypothetical protein
MGWSGRAPTRSVLAGQRPPEKEHAMPSGMSAKNEETASQKH